MRRSQSDRGATLVIIALSITALLLIVALVIDLGATRSDRRGGQSAVDNAAAAAGQAFAEDDAETACEEAFGFLALSLGSDPFTGDPCSELTSACDPTTERIVERTVGDYRAVVINPVLTQDLLRAPSAIGADAVDQSGDGDPCDRIGVRLTTTGDPFFGRIAGSTERVSSVHAVALVNRGTTEFRPINLLVLNRTECQVFTIGGGGGDAQVVVTSPTDDPTAPGVAALDSDASDDASCNPNKSTLELNGSGSTLRAEGPCGTIPDPGTCGRIELFTPVVDGSCAPTGDVPACNEGTGSITPDASTLSARYTRAPVDARYNCKPSYASEPWYGVQPTGACSGASSSTDYIDEINAFAGVATAPAGFTTINNSSPGGCSPDQTYPSGNYFVDCATFRINGGANVVFEGGNVIFRGDVTVTSGSLTLHQCGSTETCSNSIAWTPNGDFVESQFGPKAAWVYVNGDLSSSGTLSIAHAAVILGRADSRFSQNGGTVAWTAPDEGDVVGSAGPFDDLALWSEGVTTATGPTSSPHSFRGGGGSNFEGLFFGGRSKFDLAGSGVVNLTIAQFVSDKIAFSGGATFRMSPVSDRGVRFPIDPTSSLIR